MPTFVGDAPLAMLKTLFTQIGDSGVTTWAQSRRPKVFRERFHDDALGTASPVIVIAGVVKDWERYATEGSTEIYHLDARVTVRVFFNPVNWNPDTDAAAWEHDLSKAVRDHRLGGTVQDCTIVQTIIGIPPEGEDPRCRITMTLKLEYKTHQDNPAVQLG